MDNTEDSLFLEQVAQKHNPLQEGEYIVVQTRTGSWRLYPRYRGFSYWEAKRFADMENLGSDYSHYSVRIMQGGRLHKVDVNGFATELSKEQDWKIVEEYYHARYVDRESEDCEIETCLCSYPVFWSWRQVIGAGGATVRDWRPVTCVVGDSGREVRHCPNCNMPLLSLLEEDIDPPDTEDEEDTEDAEDRDDGDDWWDWEEVPKVCKGCQYYQPNSQISCAVHPYGIEGEFCPDYSGEAS